MLKIFMMSGLFIIPVLVLTLKTRRRGLVTGLFISLFFWGTSVPLLVLVPLGVSFFLYFSNENKPKPDKESLYVLNPSLSMLLLFMVAMTLFCALGDAFHQYGVYMQLDVKALWASKQMAILAGISGPLLIGHWCDLKGSYYTAVFLTLLAELSVLFASAGGSSLLLFVLGIFLVNFCTSGFFVLMPLLALSYFGKENFFRFYPFMVFTALAFGALTRIQYENHWLESANPAGFLLSLTLLTFLSACFVYAAWKRRFVLVAPLKTTEN